MRVNINHHKGNVLDFKSYRIKKKKKKKIVFVFMSLLVLNSKEKNEKHNDNI